MMIWKKLQKIVGMWQLKVLRKDARAKKMETLCFLRELFASSVSASVLVKVGERS